MAAEQEGKRAPFVVEWRDCFKVKIPQIDYEHRHLFALVKALNLQSVDRTLQELLDYVVTHFSNEQALMENSGYPAFADHLKLHEAFNGFVGEYLGSSDVWSEERVRELRRFLNKWLIGHIMTHDLRFGNWYVQHGRAVRPKQEAPVLQRGFFSRVLGIR